VTVAFGFRRRVKIGPALHIAPLPITSLAVSSAMHAVLIVLAVIAVNALQESQPKTYIVNLVPAVAAIGSPQGRASAPPAPTPVTPRAPAPAPAPEPPARDVAPRDLPPRPSPPRDLPPRTATRDSMSLPERTLPARSAATPTPPPRRQEKELPAVASAKASTPVAPPTPTPAPAPAPTPAAATTPPGPPVPPQPLGQPTGSPVGAGKLTVDVDFPYAWYLRVLVNKINERWDGRALPGNQPLVVFEIDKTGGVNLNRLKIEKSSGNPAYDQVALRAIAESTPFPPLPADFKASYLRIHLQFDYTRGG
jgi:TonB family protein